MQWVYDIGWQAAVKKKPKNVVAVMSGSLKSYFYFVCRTSAAANGLQQGVEAFCIVWNGANGSPESSSAFTSAASATVSKIL